jgi:hypothetical protein
MSQGAGALAYVATFAALVLLGGAIRRAWAGDDNR